MIAFLALLLASHAHASEDHRLLTEASRRVDRADHERALAKLDALNAEALSDADRAWAARLSADAHRQAAVDKGTADPAYHLDKSFESHNLCLASEGQGTGVHLRHCQGQSKLLRRAIDARAGLILKTLELGGAAAPSEAQARCEQLVALSDQGVDGARCLARLAWVRKDADRAAIALEQLIALRSDTDPAQFDAIAGQALATPLRGLGDPERTQAMLDTVPADAQGGASIVAIQASLSIFTQKLLPRKSAAYAENTPKAWGVWLRGLTQAGLDPLALTEADVAAKRFPDDAALHEIIAVVFVNAAARLPPEQGPARIDRLNQQRRWLIRAQEAANQCGKLQSEHPRCPDLANSLLEQIKGIEAQLQ